MRYVTTAILGLSALALVSGACNTGAEGIPHKGGAGTTGTGMGGGGTGGAGGTTDQMGNGGTGAVETGTAGSGGTTGTTGVAGAGSVGSAGTTGMAGSDGIAGATGTAGSEGTAGATGTAGTTGAAGTGGSVMSGTGGTAGAGGAATGLRSGPFKIIVLSSALDFPHDSIPTCLRMLQDLGKATAPERAKITGLAPDSTWTVDQIGDDPTKPNYFSEVSADNLKNYELFYSNNPTGPVFTNAPNGAQKKQAFVDYWNNGGSWAGQHSATDFEKHGSWTWFQDNIDGAYFIDHDPPTATGAVSWEPGYINHPILKGLASPWSTSDEWYVVHRNVEAVPGFKVIAKVTVSNSSLGTSPRPAVWIRENTNNKGGRSFYTIRGHDHKVYAEPQFRDLMLRGILWSVHRLPGGS